MIACVKTIMPTENIQYMNENTLILQYLAFILALCNSNSVWNFVPILLIWSVNIFH